VGETNIELPEENHRSPAATEDWLKRGAMEPNPWEDLRVHPGRQDAPGTMLPLLATVLAGFSTTIVTTFLIPISQQFFGNAGPDLAAWPTPVEGARISFAGSDWLR
jgi:hypothetical protein